MGEEEEEEEEEEEGLKQSEEGLKQSEEGVSDGELAELTSLAELLLLDQQFPFQSSMAREITLHTANKKSY